MPDLILHHYPQSPVSEKVRVVLGMKGLAWRSVIIPRVPPKPELVPLTGGYRRTPVLQVGADIYCDSHCIIREIERRHPEPSLYPDGGPGLHWGLARWTDGPFFQAALSVVLGSQVGKMPADFAADRGRLYFGPDYDLDQVAADLAHSVAQLRGHFQVVEESLQDGRPFLFGESPGLADALCYYLAWFVAGRYDAGTALLARYVRLSRWSERMRAIGHGRAEDLAAAEALRVAAGSQPDAAPTAEPIADQGLSPGAVVLVTPDGEGGDPSVAGELVAANDREIVIRRDTADLGPVAVHFPRLGFRITAS